MKNPKSMMFILLGMVLMTTAGSALAEVLGDSSVDQPTCCEPCHITTNCKSPEAPNRMSASTNNPSNSKIESEIAK